VITLGIDPGLRLTGYACIRVAGPRCEILEAGVIRLRRRDEEDPKAAPSVSQRLAELDREFRALLERLTPESVAVEGLFAHREHPATGMIMGHARGVLLLAVAQRGLPLVELKPAAVKKFLTGSGRADKGQMQRAVQQHFGLAEAPTPADVADAIAIALCASERSRLGLPAPTASGARKRRRTLPADVLAR